MRSILLLLFLPALFAANPELVKVKSVYLLSMSNAMDQYLANQLQQGSSYVVVTDPNMADAVFTDSLGPAFEKKMLELYPPEVDEDEEPRENNEALFHGFRKGRGMVFLVERRTRQVVWSTYELPKNQTARKMDQAARRIAEKLKKELVGKAPK